MLRIIIHGCNGKMGGALAQAAAVSPDSQVAAGIDTSQDLSRDAPSSPFPVFSNLKDCDREAEVIIDFSSPRALPALLEGAAAKGIPLIIATTGHTAEDQQAIRNQARRIPIFQSANMSLGINLMAELAKKAATVLGEGFDIEIIEKHHNLKKDAPSGTALALAESINEALAEPKEYVFGRQTRAGKRSPRDMGIHAVRAGTIVGEHEIIFAGNNELLEIRHAAQSRTIFALGALQAARYLHQKPAGLYSMKHMIAEQSTVTSLYTSQDEALISITRLPWDPRTVAGIFRRIGQENINIDVISQTAPLNDQVSISFTLSRQEVDKTLEILRQVKKSLSDLGISVAREIVKVTAQGVGMELQSGVAAKLFEVLASLEIGVKSVSTSETKISCIIDQSDAPRVVEAIQEAFGI